MKICPDFYVGKGDNASTILALLCHKVKPVSLTSNACLDGCDEQECSYHRREPYEQISTTRMYRFTRGPYQ